MEASTVNENHTFIFNGPPRSGKDTAANHAYEHSAGWNQRLRIKFAQPIDDAISAIFRLSPDYYHRWQKYRNDPILKDSEPFLDASGKTAREIMIGFSEVFAKPYLGQGIFAYLAAQQVRKIQRHYNPTLTVVSDCGFQEEFDIFARRTAKDSQIHLITLNRTGCDFSNDSRQYVQPNNWTQSHTVLENNSTQAEFEKRIIELIKELRE